MEMNGKHALVTGSSKRVGRAIAESLLAQGVRLSAHYHQSKEEMARWQKGLSPEVAARFHSIQGDLRSVPSLAKMVGVAEKKFGPIDILISCASAFYKKSALETTPEDWDEMMEVNARGQFFLATACAKGMLAASSGFPRVIINFADVSGSIGAKGYSPYVFSKAALLMVTRNLAKEWAPKIRVNSVSPGPVLEPENYTEEQRNHAALRTLLKRWGTPEDVVHAVNFLIGNDYVTGIDLKVDGGRSIA